MTTLVMGFTPDPDDAFGICALATGKVATPTFKIRFQPEPIEILNRMTARGELDVSAISSVFYPRIRDRVAVLRPGASVGRGYGPALVARDPVAPEELRGKRVAVPGTTTTGATLARLLLPGIDCVPLPFERIRLAVANGEFDAGVLIHEELLEYDESRLHRVLCLGQEWQRRTGMPLPVGLNVIRRDLPPFVVRDFARAFTDSIAWAMNNPDEAFEWARRFARSRDTKRSLRFTHMFANSDTLRFPPECEAALLALFRELSSAGLAPRVDEVDYVEPPAVAATAGEAW